MIDRTLNLVQRNFYSGDRWFQHAVRGMRRRSHGGRMLQSPGVVTLHVINMREIEAWRFSRK